MSDQQSAYNHYKVITWPLHGITWPLHGITWPLHDITWPSHDHCMFITWLSLKYTLGVTPKCRFSFYIRWVNTMHNKLLLFNVELKWVGFRSYSCFTQEKRLEKYDWTYIFSSYQSVFLVSFIIKTFVWRAMIKSWGLC